MLKYIIKGYQTGTTSLRDVRYLTWYPLKRKRRALGTLRFHYYLDY